MPKVSQLNDATVNALMLKLGFGGSKESILRWALPADGTDLSLAYDRAIAAGQRTLRIPEGNWTWSTPKDYVNGLSIIGAKPMKTSGVTGSKITAPNGFLKNADTTREQIVVKRLYVLGTRVAGSVAIDGPFGGEVCECKFEGFDWCIRNMSAYLSFYDKNSFENAGFGICFADANGVEVSRSHFAANVAVQITTRDGTPQTGVNSGLPLSLYQNNHNLSDATTVAVKVRGQVEMRSCYFEKFSGSVLNTMVDLEANRFDHQGFIMENCELNGQGSNCRGIYINGSSNLDNWTEGRITSNRFLGLATYVEYGVNNRVPNLKIYGNSRTSGDFTIPIVNSYQNQHVPNYDGWTYVPLGSDFSTSLATLDDVPGLAFTPDSNALYVVEFVGLMRTSSAAVGARPGITWPLGVGDGVAFSAGASSANATTVRYGNTSSATFEMTTSALADATGSWPAEMRATFNTGTITGPFKIGLRSGTAATSVTMKAGSYMRYRRIV